MKVEETCFAYNEETKDCSALKELQCKKSNCKFFKTREQLLKQYKERIK